MASKMSRAKRRREHFPKQLYVYRENFGTEDEFYSTNEGYNGIPDGAPVAIYVLKEIKRMSIKEELV